LTIEIHGNKESIIATNAQRKSVYFYTKIFIVTLRYIIEQYTNLQNICQEILNNDEDLISLRRFCSRSLLNCFDAGNFFINKIKKH